MLDSNPLTPKSLVDQQEKKRKEKKSPLTCNSIRHAQHSAARLGAARVPRFSNLPREALVHSCPAGGHQWGKRGSRTCFSSCFYSLLCARVSPPLPSPLTHRFDSDRQVSGRGVVKCACGCGYSAEPEQLPQTIRLLFSPCHSAASSGVESQIYTFVITFLRTEFTTNQETHNSSPRATMGDGNVAKKKPLTLTQHLKVKIK